MPNARCSERELRPHPLVGVRPTCIVSLNRRGQFCSAAKTESTLISDRGRIARSIRPKPRPKALGPPKPRSRRVDISSGRPGQRLRIASCIEIMSFLLVLFP